MATTELPMPTPTVPRKPLLSFKLLSLDIFGTLIDWESSIISHLQPLVSHIPAASPLKTDRTALARLYNTKERALQQEEPGLRYDQLLAEAYKRVAAEIGAYKTRGSPESNNDDDSKLETDATAFGSSIGSWPAFPDTVDAMQRLAKHYKLVPLSNVDAASFAKTCAGPLRDVPFWRIYVAEDIGSYKPDLRNFHYLIDHVTADGADGGGGVDTQDEILHTAQSLQHDHVPAKEMGMSSVWIARQGAKGGMGGLEDELHAEAKVGYGWRFATLGEMADAVEREATEGWKG